MTGSSTLENCDEMRGDGERLRPSLLNRGKFNRCEHISQHDDARRWAILFFGERFFASRGRATVLLLGHAHGILCGRP